MTHWKLRQSEFFSNKIFFNNFFIRLNRLEFSIKLTVICTGKPSITHHIVIFSLLWWSGTEHTMFLRFVCTRHRLVPRNHQSLLPQATLQKTIKISFSENLYSDLFQVLHIFRKGKCIIIFLSQIQLLWIPYNMINYMLLILSYLQLQ